MQKAVHNSGESLMGAEGGKEVILESLRPKDRAL